MTVLMIQSHYQAPFTMGGALFSRHIEAGTVCPVREMALTEAHFATATGLITSTHLDQIGFQHFAGAVKALLDRGGRWILNGHILRPILPELSVFQPIAAPKRADFEQSRLYDHPVFAGLDQKALETNRGVAGFYGRGHNPPPEGARIINALGAARTPVDWVWARPQGGEVLCHAGNEFWACGDDADLKQELADRAVAWVNGELN